MIRISAAAVCFLTILFQALSEITWFCLLPIDGAAWLATLSPSMRRPVSVKSVFSSSFLWVPCVRAAPPLSPSFHPHSFVERLSLGASWAFPFQQCCYLIIDLSSPLFRQVLGQALVAVT